MKEKCKALGIVTIILGIFGGLAAAITMGKDIYGRRSIGLTLGIFVGIFISSLILTFILYALSEILEKLEALQKSPSKMAPKSDSINNTPKEEMLAEGEWKCLHCGTINPFKKRSCWCGQKRE